MKISGYRAVINAVIASILYFGTLELLRIYF